MDSPINLKKAMRDREESAGLAPGWGDRSGTPPTSMAGQTGGVKFGKPFSASEKAAHAKALADKLRNR